MKALFLSLHKKKSVWIAIILLSIVLISWLFRENILKGCAQALIYETTLKPEYDAIFILGGNAVERGKKASELYQTTHVKEVVCTGEFVAHEFQMLNLHYTEAEFSKFCAVKFGIPDSVIIVANQGTSTKEEAEFYLNFTLKNNYENVIVVTSKIHTGRAHKIFKKIWKDKPFDIIGAESLNYDVNQWWKSEDGLIAVNNEWMKSLYYFWKY